MDITANIDRSRLCNRACHQSSAPSFVPPLRRPLLPAPPSLSLSVSRRRLYHLRRHRRDPTLWGRLPACLPATMHTYVRLDRLDHQALRQRLSAFSLPSSAPPDLTVRGRGALALEASAAMSTGERKDAWVKKLFVDHTHTHTHTSRRPRSTGAQRRWAARQQACAFST